MPALKQTALVVWGEVAGMAQHCFQGLPIMTSVALMRARALFAGLEFELAGGVGGDDGGDALIADGEDDLGEQSFDGDFHNGASKLIASADAGGAGVGGRVRQELVERFGGDAVVASGRLHVRMRPARIQCLSAG